MGRPDGCTAAGDRFAAMSMGEPPVQPRGRGVVRIAIRSHGGEAARTVIDGLAPALGAAGYEVAIEGGSTAADPTLSFVVAGELGEVGERSTIRITDGTGAEIRTIVWLPLPNDVISPVILPGAIAEALRDHQFPPPPLDVVAERCELEPEDCWTPGVRLRPPTPPFAGRRLLWRSDDLAIELRHDDLDGWISAGERRRIAAELAQGRTMLFQARLPDPVRGRVAQVVFDAVWRGAPVMRCGRPPAREVVPVVFDGGQKIAFVDATGVVIAVPTDQVQ